MVKQIAKAVAGEWLETGRQTVKKAKLLVTGVKTEEVVKDLYGADEESLNKERLKRLKETDKKKSSQGYREIQEKIELERKKKASQPRKYVTGKAGFDEQQVKEPEKFFDKIRQKKEKEKEKLPLRVEKGMGTGERWRGAGG